MDRRKFIILLISFYLSNFVHAVKKPLAKQFNIKLSEFKAVGVPADEAFKLLSDQVRKEDPDKKGLLIIFKAKKIKKISLNINSMPVINVINYLCLSGNYRYTITGRTVNITDK